MIALAMTFALIAGAQDKPLTVADLTYAETFACAALGLVAQEWATEQLNGEAPGPEEQQLFRALQGLAERAAGALDAAQARDGLDAAGVEAAQSAALDGLAATEDETLFAMTDLCGTIFGVNFD